MPLVTRNSENARVWVGTSAPANPSNGDLFSNTSDDTLTVYDGSTFQTIGVSSFSGSAVVSNSETIGDYTTPSGAQLDVITVSNSGTWNITPALTEPIDGDLGTKNAQWKRQADTGIQQYDYGSNRSREFVVKFGYDMKQSGTCTVYLDYSSNGSDWTNQFTDTTTSATETTTTETFTVTARYLRFYVTSSNPSEEARGYMYEVYQTETTANIFDDDTGTDFTSPTMANPFIIVDTGSSQNLLGIAYYHDSATTETEIKIQSSNDLSTWTDLRTITVSNLTAASYNYIRFNLVKAQYLRIYGNSGSSLTLAISELKYLTKTDSEILQDLGILEISSSDTSIGLDGV